MKSKIKEIFSDEKAQASIETLLLIAAAILIATVVGLYIKNNLVGQKVQSEIGAGKAEVLKNI